MMEIDYEKKYPLVQYGSGEDAPIYIRLCPNCGRFVQADSRSTIPEYLINNATCKRCGRIKMPFYCWAGDMDGGEEDAAD